MQYLGNVIGADGLHAIDAKIEAIVNAPSPKNVTELRSYLGLLNYYGRFIPNLASLVHPLNKLLRHNMTWRWTKSCQDAFKSTKEKIVSPNVLVHYDMVRPLRLTADASAYGSTWSVQVAAASSEAVTGRDSICCRLNIEGSDMYAIGLMQLSGSL